MRNPAAIGRADGLLTGKGTAAIDIGRVTESHYYLVGVPTF
jgi:hypothetical protein